MSLPKLQWAKVVGVGVDPSEYHKANATRNDPAFVMSRSALMDFYECPSKWIRGWNPRGNKSQVWGDLVDTMVLDPNRFQKRFCICPETYPSTPKKKGAEPEQKPWNRNATYCEEYEASHGGTSVLTREYREAERAVRRLMEHADSAEFIRCSQKQVMCMAGFLDPDTGLEVQVKTLMDLVPDKASRFGDCLGDFKTGKSADPAKWPNSVEDFAYAEQGAIYIDVWNKAAKEQRTTFAHILQENEEPYEVADPIPALSEEFLAFGRERYLCAIQLFARCRATGKWPSYAPARFQYGGFQFIEPRPNMLLKYIPRVLEPIPTSKQQPTYDTP